MLCSYVHSTKKLQSHSRQSAAVWLWTSLSGSTVSSAFSDPLADNSDTSSFNFIKNLVPSRNQLTCKRKCLQCETFRLARLGSFQLSDPWFTILSPHKSHPNYSRTIHSFSFIANSHILYFRNITGKWQGLCRCHKVRCLCSFTVLKLRIPWIPF